MKQRTSLFYRYDMQSLFCTYWFESDTDAAEFERAKTIVRQYCDYIDNDEYIMLDDLSAAERLQMFDDLQHNGFIVVSCYSTNHYR